MLTCIYFSIVTKTTLGDGSIGPQGMARVVVCVQVMLGLVVAGAVATIQINGDGTSTPQTPSTPGGGPGAATISMVTPEPSTFLLLATVLAGVCVVKLKRRGSAVREIQCRFRTAC